MASSGVVARPILGWVADHWISARRLLIVQGLTMAVLAWVVRHWQAELDAFKLWRDAQSRETRQSLALLPGPERPARG